MTRQKTKLKKFYATFGDVSTSPLKFWRDDDFNDDDSEDGGGQKK